MSTKTDEEWTEEQWNEWGIFFNLDSEIERANLIRQKLLKERDEAVAEAVKVERERKREHDERTRYTPITNEDNLK